MIDFCFLKRYAKMTFFEFIFFPSSRFIFGAFLKARENFRDWREIELIYRIFSPELR